MQDLLLSANKRWDRLHKLLFKLVGQMTLSTVLTVSVLSHKDSSATGFSRALTTKMGNLASTIDLVVLENAQLDLLSLVLDLLWSSVDLLLALLATTTKTKDQMQGGFFLNVVVRQGSAIFQLLSSENQSLLIWRNSYVFNIFKL